MAFNLAAYLGKRLVRLIWLGAAAAVVAQGVYFYKFAYQTGGWFALSSDQTDWASFGGFVGGLLGPYFSFLAFIGVVLTVVLQARQIDEMKAQAGLEEMQRVMSTVTTRIDSLLAVSVQPGLEQAKVVAVEPRTLWDLIAALGTLKLREGVPQTGNTDFGQWLWNEVHTAATAELDRQSSPLRLEIEALAWMLLKYQAANGNATVMEYHRYRYLAIVVWLDALGLLEVHGQIQQFFKPKDNRVLMVPKP